MLVAGSAIAAIAPESRPPGNDPELQGAIAPAGQPRATWALRDQDGRLVRAAGLRGRPMILSFLYTTCEDTCPVTAQQIRGALDRLGDDVPAVAVSVDPANDTGPRARAFLAKQNLTGRMSFLLGTRAQLQRVWRQYGVQPQEDGLEHSARVVLLDDAGRPAVAWPTEKLTPEGLAHDLRLLNR